MGSMLDYVWKVSEPFPFGEKTLLYWLFAALVVHVCHRLIEQTSSVSDPLGKRVNASHAAVCIGCLVWTMDVVGFFMYPGDVLDGMHLTPSLAALVIMTAGARLTVPTLSGSTRILKVGAAGFGLTLAMLVGHLVLARRLFGVDARINLPVVLLALLLAAALSLLLAFQHRKARLRAFAVEYRQLCWRDKAVAGLVVVVVHWLLANVFSGGWAGVGDQEESGIKLLVTIMVFGMAVAVDQMYNLYTERSRQRFWSHALSLVRKSPTQEGNGSIEHQLSLIADRLPTLLTPQRMQVYFQPIIKSVRDQWHQEALLRVRDEQLGVINPEVFFLACELRGMTAQVDRMIINIALDHVCRWQQQGFRQTFISVNVSAGTLLAEDFAGWLNDALRERVLNPSLLRLEMTEHGIIASGSKMLTTLAALKALGVGVVMDDFGAGYSSLGVLAELPIVGIKCDRLFVKELGRDPRRQRILRHIATLAHDLGVTVTAEGVETQEELDLVHASGISSIQGYFYSAAMPASDIPAWQQAFHARRNQLTERQTCDLSDSLLLE